MSNTALASIPALRERIRQLQTPTLDTRILPTHPVMQKWWAHMADIMATLPDNEPVAVPLVPMFHLP